MDLNDRLPEGASRLGVIERPCEGQALIEVALRHRIVGRNREMEVTHAVEERRSPVVGVMKTGREPIGRNVNKTDVSERALEGVLRANSEKEGAHVGLYSLVDDGKEMPAHSPLALRRPRSPE